MGSVISVSVTRRSGLVLVSATRGRSTPTHASRRRSCFYFEGKTELFLIPSHAGHVTSLLPHSGHEAGRQLSFKLLYRLRQEVSSVMVEQSRPTSVKLVAQ